jgi:hypothetical protein
MLKNVRDTSVKSKLSCFTDHVKLLVTSCHSWVKALVRTTSKFCNAAIVLGWAGPWLLDDDDVYLIKLQREMLQNLISTRRMQISQICGISKENTLGIYHRPQLGALRP